MLVAFDGTMWGVVWCWLHHSLPHAGGLVQCLPSEHRKYECARRHGLPSLTSVTPAAGFVANGSAIRA
jgi:hypothetical protein